MSIHAPSLLASGFRLLLLAVCLLPFGVMLASSLADGGQAYARLFTQIPFGAYTLNSLMVALWTTLGQVLLSAMAGWAFARLSFPGRPLWFMLVLATLMIPPQVNLVPLFFMMKALGWMNTPWALIVPGLFHAYGIFWLRQWFSKFPRELEEAAALDGCSPWDTFWRVALPTALPALAPLALFAFINSWNGFLWPLVVIHTDTWRTLPLGLAQLKGSFRDTLDWPLLMAGATMSVLPLVGLFVWGQRWLMRGMLGGAVKG
jgi:multiple sugar transport system permease protein